MHIAINQGLQKIGSFHADNFLPEEIDLELNKQILRFVEQRYNKKGNKYQTGFEESQKRIDDLRTLVREYEAPVSFKEQLKTKIFVDANYGENAYDDLPASTKFMLADYTYNLGKLSKYPKFADAIMTGNTDLALQEYIRNDEEGGSPLARNNAYLEQYLQPWVDNTIEMNQKKLEDQNRKMQENLRMQEQFVIPADRIEAGTYLIAAAITGGDVTISNVQAPRMNNILDKLKLSGASVIVGDDTIQLIMENDSILPVDISTAPFPGFPTDMQAQFTVLNALSEGSSVVTENVFENRFMHVQELNRMGCDITVKGSNAFIKGVSALNGAPVMATDLRASASLILAGLCAKGETIVDRIYHIDRGYERIEEKLSYLGADITRLPN